MYQLQYIKIKNIGTIKSLDYNFLNGKSQIIQGRNLDNKGQKNNGVGKSFFIDSIGFAITGIVLSGRTTEEFIRDNESEAYIELYAKTKDNNRDLLIKRFLSRKKSQLIEIYVNGKPQHKDEHDVNSRNQFIVDEIGISRDDLFQFFLISKDRYKAYFKLSDTEKKNITSRFSNASIIDNIFPFIEKDIELNEVENRTISDNIIKLNTSIELYENTLNDINEKDSNEFKEQLKKSYSDKIIEFEAEKKSKLSLITSSEEKLKELSLLDVDIAEKIKNNFSNIDDLNKFILELSNKLDLKNTEVNSIISEYNENIKLLDSELIKLKKELSSINKDKNETIILKNNINNKLQSSITCPACEHEFILDKDANIDELKESLTVINDVLLELEQAINDKEVEIIKVETSISSNEKLIQQTRELYKEEIDKINNDIVIKRKSRRLLEDQESLFKSENKTIDFEITSCKSQINKLEANILLLDSYIENNKRLLESVDDESHEADINKYEQLINTFKDNLVEKNRELSESEAEIRRLNEWLLKFKSFKSYLANLSLKNIEDLINFYLNKMETDLSVEIDGYKQKGKKITEKITEKILRNGVNVGSYNRFSGGERARIDVGSILANQTLINNNAAPRGLDLIIIDEVLESSDSLGIENIIKSMENIDKTMLLITQNEINSLPERTITFIKQNEETKLQ